ncbi:unnamed protein product, partial [Pylaiella littoralis]
MFPLFLGVTAADVPRVIITHEFFSVAFLAFTWAACYQIQPSKSPVFAPINKTLQESNNVFIAKSRQSFEALLSRSERRISHEWLSKRGIDSVRVAVSLAESTVFRKVAKPVTIPAKLWLTLKCVQGLGTQVDDGDGMDGGTAGGGGRGKRAKRRRSAQAEEAGGNTGEMTKGARGDGRENARAGSGGPARSAEGAARGGFFPSSSSSSNTRGWGLGG